MRNSGRNMDGERRKKRQKTDRKDRKRFLLRAAAVTLILGFVCYLLCTINLLTVSDTSYDYYGQDWIFSGNGQEKIVDLPSSEPVEAGDAYTISHKVSWNLPQDCWLMFRSLQQHVEIYLDETLLYTYPSVHYLADLTPNHWNLVKLPEDAGGKTLTIRLRTEYPSFSGKMGEIYLGRYQALFHQVRGMYAFPFWIGILAGAVGCVIVLVSLFFRVHRSIRAELALGFLLIFSSFWLCGEAKMPFVHVDPLVQYFLVFQSMFLIPMCFYLYIDGRMKERQKRISLWPVWGNLCVMTACTFLQLTGIRDYPHMLPVIHGVIAVVFLCGVFVMGRELYLKSGIFDRREYFFILLFFLAMGVEMVRFYMGRYRLLGIYIRVILLLYACSVLLAGVLRFYHAVKNNQRLSELLLENRIALMISQIQPHFIYNVLNSIRTLIRLEPARAYDMVYDFSNYLRAHIDSLGNQKEVPFSRELEHIRSYVNIEQVRFGERVRAVYEIDTTAFYLPALSVQPLVENAIKHGLGKKTCGGTVWIRSYTDPENPAGFVVEVEDDGAGFDFETWKSRADSHSQGIQNIQFRLSTISKGTLTIQSRPDCGTKAVIRLPDRGGL